MRARLNEAQSHWNSHNIRLHADKASKFNVKIQHSTYENAQDDTETLGRPRSGAVMITELNG